VKAPGSRGRTPRVGGWIAIWVTGVLAGASCSSLTPTAVNTGSTATSPAVSSASSVPGTDAMSAAPKSWVCASPSTFTPVPPPPGVPGLPDVKTTATAREYADGEVGRFNVAPMVVEAEQSTSRAVFQFVGEQAMLVGEVTVIRRDDGRWILSVLKSCRDLERPA